MQIQDQPHIGVLGADPAAITQFLRRVQALGGEHAVLLPLSPAAVRRVCALRARRTLPAGGRQHGAAGAGRAAAHRGSNRRPPRIR